MGKYGCAKCGKEFNQKSHYERHVNKKNPCIYEDKLNEIIDKKIEEKINNIENINNETPKKTTEFSALSKQLTNDIPKEIKKNNGIYFTPPSCIYKNIEVLKKYFKNISNVLEPSCGSGEYITILQKIYPYLDITGIEFNQTIFKSIEKMNSNNVTIKNLDFLKMNDDTKYDLIIGNPPYFVMKKKDIDEKYCKYFEGRPNIFIIFILKSLELLNDNGILSFVLPKNFMNCLYYAKTRKHIFKKFQIIDLFECSDKYIETQQETIILIIRKQSKIDNSQFVIDLHKYIVFSYPDNIVKINQLYENSKSFHDLDFKVSVGTVVWNQCKDILTDDTKETRLIYSSDIKNNQLIMKNYSNKEKKNFIKKAGIKNPTLVINRGYGVGEYKFDYCLIDGDFNYLIENHLICITYKKTISPEELMKLYQKIISSLNDERTLEFIKLYFGNNAINTTEMNYILPIYQDI